jgi:hypothetical protein
MSASSTISNLQQALSCAGKCDCCSNLQQQINEINSKIANLKPVDENAIVNRAIEGAKILMPGIAGTVIAMRLAPVLTEVKTASSIASQALKLGGDALKTGTQALGKATSALGQLAALVASIAAVLGVIATLNVLGGRIDAVENGVDTLANDLSRVFGLIQGVKSIATGADSKAVKAQTGVDDLYRYTGELSSRILETKGIANSALDTANTALNSANEANKRIITVANTANSAYTLSKENKIEIDGHSSQIQQINTELTANNQAHSKLQTEISEANNKATTALNTATEALTTAKAIQPIAESAKATATTANTKADKAEIEAAKALREASNAISKVQEAQGEIAKLRQQTASTEKKVVVTEEKIRIVDGEVTQVEVTTSKNTTEIDKATARLRELQKQGISRVDINTVSRKIEQIDTKWNETIQKQSQQINKIEQKLANPAINTASKEVTRAEFDQVKQRIGEADKVNEAGNRKIDEILSKLPAIPAATAAAVAARVPSIPAIKQAVGEATCESARGGCIAGALNNQSNGLRQDFGQKLRDLEQGLNAGANAAQLTLLNTINTKLGAEIVGGIGGSLSKFYEWAHVDRILNVLTFAATIHNAMMLSNDIAATLTQALSNVLQVIGIKDKDGGALNLGAIIGSSIENAIKGVIGAENYTELSQSFAKANRIYQSSVNVLNSFQSVSSSILSGMEVVGSMTGKMGNALKSAGVVLESAYSWMNPQPKFNRITAKLEAFQGTASTILQVTQVPIDIANSITELNQSSTELVNAIKADGEDANKGVGSPEPEQLKTSLAIAKVVSAGVEMTSADLEADEG